MNSINQKKLVEYWSKGSKIDLQSSIEIATRTKRYAHALFFLHLALEKTLKSAYVKKFNKQAPFIHNLVNLAEKCEIDLSNDQRKLLSLVNEFNLECRYPDAKLLIYKKATARITKSLQKEAQEFITWLTNKSS